MDNNSNHIDILISKVLSGNASVNEIKELDEWKRSSSENHKNFKESSKLWNTNNNFISNQIKDSDFRKIKTVILKQKTANKKQYSIVQILQRVAAILFIPVLLTFGWYYIYSTNSNKPVQFTEITSPIGQISKCILADGSEIWLNSGTTLKYNNLFNSESRDVYLNGEAYFKVKTNQSKPFRIQTNSIKVQVHGTSFNVAAYQESNEVETILEEGSVEIILKEKTGQSVFIKPGERAIYNIEKQNIKIDRVETELHTAWHKGKFRFKDANLFMIFDELERIYDVSIQLQDSTIGNIRLRGMFEYNHNIIDALYKIEKTTNLKYQIQGRIVRVDYKNKK